MNIIFLFLFSFFKCAITGTYYQLLPYFTYIPSIRRSSSNKPPSVFEPTSLRHGDTLITPSHMKLLSRNYSNSIHFL